MPKSEAQLSGEAAFFAAKRGGPTFGQIVSAFNKYAEGRRPGDADWSADDSRVLSWVLRPDIKTPIKRMNMEHMIDEIDPTRRG